MLTELSTVTLKSNQQMTIARLEGPDSHWSERIIPLLAHKGGIWNWQNHETLVTDVEPLNARFYIGLIEDTIVGNVCTFTYGGTGILGHVFTSPDHRRKGICKAIMTALFSDFNNLEGRALFLGTGYDSPPWHIYKSFGFSPIYPASGEMEWYRNDINTFESTWFTTGPAHARAADWRDWSGLTALMCQRSGSSFRLASAEVHNRSSMEHAFLPLYRDNLKQRGTHMTVLESDSSKATVGVALILPDSRFPGSNILDLFVHPNFEASSASLLKTLPLDKVSGRILAYAESHDKTKIAALEGAGFTSTAVVQGLVKLHSGTSDLMILSR